MAQKEPRRSPRRRQARSLFLKACDSLFLSIDHFNRPYERGRKEAVLIFADRAFELLLKAIIVERGGVIIDRNSGHSIGFGKCVQKCLNDAAFKCLRENDALNIQMINALRDAAQHHILDVSEPHLYIHCQAALSLFRRLVQEQFRADPLHWLSERTLPVSTRPPMDFATVVEATLADIRALAAPRKRRSVEAIAKLRSLLALERAIAGRFEHPTEREISKTLQSIQAAGECSSVFPGVAALSLESGTDGIALHLRISKRDGTAIRLVHEDSPDAVVVAVKRVNELDYYSMGLKGVAEKIGHSLPKTLAICKELKIMCDVECYKEFRIGSQTHKRYSQKSVEKIRRALPLLDLNAVWATHKPSGRSKAKVRHSL